MRTYTILSDILVPFLLSCLIFGPFYCEVNGQGFRIAPDEVCGKIEEIPGELRTKIPWTAAIFGRAGSKSPYQFSVTGTLIGPTTVVTLFGGAFGVPSGGSSKYFIPRAENYIVAVGLTSNNLDESDVFTQIIQVSHILPWRAQNDQKYFNYFLFHLKKPVNLKTPYVRSACIPEFLKHLATTPHGRQIEVRQGGFKTPPREDGFKALTLVNITLESKEFCDDIFMKNYNGSPENTFCGRASSHSPEVACVEPGSSGVVPILSNRYFLITLASLIPNSGSRNWCNANTVYIYGRIIKALDWFLTNLKCSPAFACSDSSCIPLSKVCDQRQDCLEGEDEDPIYCRARKPCMFGEKTWECGIYGKCITPKQVCDGTVDCEDGEDESRSLNCPTRLSAATPGPGRKSNPPATTASKFPVLNSKSAHCVPLQASEGVEIDCQLPNGEFVDCTQAGVHTVARHRCKKYYRSTLRSASLSLTCQEDGSWKPNRSFGCEAECGVISTGITAYIYGGEDTSQENAFPWHSAIFRQAKNQYQFICGGSLIEKTVLITAGHCVSDLSGAAVDKSQFKIIFGANSSNYELARKNRNAQIFNAKHIFIPATYDRRSLQSDIAIIQLDKPAVYGESVRPVCYLEQGNNNLPEPGTLGKVPGYGFRENERISETLLFAEFPVIAPDECKKALGRIPPLSTYCAGYRNGTSVCQGDSGSSMVFPTTVGSITKYFIRGLVSHGEVKQGRKCDPFNYAVFTHVDAFADWILQRLEGI